MGGTTPRRIQEGLDGLSPDEYEEAYYSRQPQEPAPVIIQPQPVHHR